jgi:hypothetical protein
MKTSGQKAFFSIPVLVVLAALAAGVSAPAPSRAAAQIWIKTGSPWSVTGKDDVQQLKYLTSGESWDFDPTPDVVAGLKRIDTKTVRCINIDVRGGSFDSTGKFIITDHPYLDGMLAECATLGAVPHIAFISGLPAPLQVKEADVADPALKKMISEWNYGPTSWAGYRAYCEAMYEYVLIKKGFPNAEFEVGNEPDGSGGIVPFPPKPAMGSRAAYEAAFKLYQNAAVAAVSFEQEHPGVKVRLGGLALTWAFSFRFGDFNWTEHFLRDCAEQNLKLDFLSEHYYGNISSVDGEFPATFPSFTDMLRATQGWRDKYCPGVPVYITEWGPSYRCDNSDVAAVNANNVGAAWSARFLNTMLGCGVSEALFLVATDYSQPDNGKQVDAWAWPALFLNPTLFDGKTYPKPIYHLFDMIAHLEGHRVESTRGNQSVNCFVSADPDKRKITMLVWNYAGVLPEGGVFQEKSIAEPTEINVRDAGSFFHSAQVQVETSQINGDTDNIPKLLTTGVAPDANNTAMAQLPTTTAKITQGALDFSMVLPPSSVSLVTLTENP